jgi:hypothetical protein
MAEPHFTQTRAPLSMTTRVTINIQARPEVVWAILTDARGFPRWNSTVSGIDGEIRDGSRIRIHAPGTKRTFTPTISGLVPNRRMTWAGGPAGIFRGVRLFELEAAADGSTTFGMRERFSGVMFALTKRSLPDFGPIFRRYATDLRDEAERRARPQRPEQNPVPEPVGQTL